MSSIAWFEVAAQDGGRARGFYHGLFGWGFEPFEEGMDYETSPEAGGAVYTNPAFRGILVYFATADIDESVARVRELGGRSADPEEIPDVGRYAACSDTEGNPFGLFQAD